MTASVSPQLIQAMQLNPRRLPDLADLVNRSLECRVNFVLEESKIGGGVGGKGNCGLVPELRLLTEPSLGHPLTMHIPVYRIILFPRTDQPAR